jgi:hypothetical protein
MLAKIGLALVEEEERVGLAIKPRKFPFLELRRAVGVARALRQGAAGGRRLSLLLQLADVVLHGLHHHDDVGEGGLRHGDGCG